jgi:peptidoglycan/LPS O-acetylase OafA/YrhL
VRLSEYAVGRDNNFNLLRLLAALSVIVAHSVAVLGLPPNPIVSYDRLGLSLADIALDAFFVTSGFLVTASLVNRGDLVAFLWARALRIYPALWVMLALTVLILAPSLTSLPLLAFYGAPEMHEYLYKCATLIGGVRWSLPGVFDTLPLKGEFNGSLWSLPVELRLYLYLAAGWLILAAAPRIRVKTLSLLTPVVSAVLFVALLRGRLFGAPFNPADIRVFMFVFASALYLWRDRIPLTRSTFAGVIVCLLVASFDRSAFFVAYLVCFAPLVLHCAYIPGGRIRAVNDWGDFSYGVYIYGFPIQQALAFLFPTLTLFAMIGLACGLSLGIAALSWFIIEKRALAHKGDVSAATSRMFSLGLAKISALATK